jgi:hypothetical protein
MQKVVRSVWASLCTNATFPNAQKVIMTSLGGLSEQVGRISSLYIYKKKK